MSKSVSVQIGQISERNPDGTFRSALPITRDVTPEEAKQMQQRVLDPICKLLAEKFSEYVKGCKEAGVDQP